MADVSKLNDMLQTLNDKPTARRAKRKGVELQVFVDAQGRYTITANGRTVEVGMQTEEGHAMQVAARKADALRKQGRTVSITLI